MSQKLHSKLLSIILCIAICCATLCGSIIAVNAAAADYKGTYTISVGDDKQAVPFAATEVKAQVKFDLPAGFVGGQFTAKAQSNYTIGDEVSAVAATKKDGTALTADELATVEFVTRANGSDKDIRFVIGDGVLCTSVTIEYTILLNDYVNNGNTTQYAVAIDVDGANFGVEGDYADVTFTGSDSWFHSHSAWCGLSNAVIDSTANGKHSIAASVCHLCKTVSGLDASEYTYLHIIPDHSEFDGVTTPTIAEGATEKSPTAWIGISGVTVSYADDGSLEVDVHAYSHWRSGSNDKIELLVCDQNGNELQRLTSVPNGSSYFAGNGFPVNEKMFTITGLSARDIDTQLYLVAVEYSSGTIEHSRTMPFCLADYCQNVVEGNGAIWADGATSEQIDADKDVAAALYYYGASIQESVFDKNTSTGGSSIEYVNANYDEWDGTRTEPTETDSEGNIIIRNAEQLAWIAHEGADATANKNYKVIENSVFNMKGMDGITLSSTVAQVKAAGNARVAENMYSAVQNWRSTSDSNSLAFQGNFDGNGLIAYNIYSYQYANAGLFPCVDPSTQGTITIKNVSVVASYIGAYHYTGGIVGLGNATVGTGKNLVFENCATKTSYLNDFNSTNNRTVGTIVGGLSHNGTLINNCLALNNEISSTGIIGGFFANTSNYGSNVTVSNSLSIGTAIAPTSVNVALGSKVANTTYTNVYDEDVDAATLGSAWFDTETYPELSMFHKLSKQYVDENTHKVICVLKAGDNTCDLKGVTEEHSLVKNAEGTAKVCECGYSVPVYGNIEYIAANYDEWDGTKVQPTATDSEGNIIINTAEEFAWVVLSGGSATVNVNYKVSANSVFNMKGMNGITLNSTASQVNAATKNSTHLWANDSNYFMGNFDGNGLTVYNINAAVGASYGYTGLFTVVRPENDAKEINIKNVTVAASYFEGYHYTGGIIGFAQNQSSNTGCVNVDSCATKNCYFYDTVRTHNSTSGLIIGQINHNSGNVTNCLAINNISDAAKIKGGIVGTSSDYVSTQKISDCVVIGSLPYSIVVEGSGGTVGTRIQDATVTNVYTDQTSTNAKYTTLDTSKLTGTGAVANMGLDDIWFDTATYPELSIFHTMADEYVNEDTHKSVCIITINGANCTVCGVGEDHSFVKNAEKNIMECACGYYEDIIGNTVTPNHTNYDEWDGTRTEPTETDSEGNIIIRNAEQLAWIAHEGADATANKNYKVIENSVFNMKGMDGITLSSTVAQVKAAGNARVAENMYSAVQNWRSTSDSNSLAFQGNFDGNGLIAYNIYSYQYANAGLFPCVDPSTQGTITIKNVSVVASYIGAYHYTGGIVGLGNATVGTGKNLVFENCATKTSYLNDFNSTNNRTVGTIVGGLSHNGTLINNCLALNNEISSTGIIGGFFANTSNYGSNVTVSNSLSIGTAIAPTSVNVALGSKVANTTYTNVYDEDVAAATLGSAWFDTTTYPELSVFHDMTTIYIDANTHQSVCQHFINGTQCTTTAPTVSHTMVDAEDGKSASCECGYSYEIKGIHAMNLPSSVLNRITSNTVYTQKFATNALFKDAYNADVYGTQVQDNVFDMYATSLNLKVNPHIAFTFAFHGDYKTNKANITATFSVEGQVIATVTGAEMINNAGAGRYHLYRLKSLGVTKLSKPVTVTVTYGGETYDFGTYSAAGYAINAMNAGEDYQEHVNASMALVYYSEMLAARQGK